MRCRQRNLLFHSCPEAAHSAAPSLSPAVPPAVPRAGVPCALTAVVGFETTPQRLQEMRSAQREGRRFKLNKYAVGGVAGAAVVAGEDSSRAASCQLPAAEHMPTVPLVWWGPCCCRAGLDAV